VKARLQPRINLECRTPLETVIPLATPFIVFADPASSCNFKCTFCPTGYRDLIAETGRFQGVMKYDLFQKIVDDLGAFEQTIKVLRMYKDGEPLLNKRFADMVAYAKRAGHIEYIDTTTNGTFLQPERMGPILEAGIDKINISVDGMSEETYARFTGFKFDFAQLVDNVKWIYANKGACEIAVKIPGELITDDERKLFFDTFGDHCDRIFVENFAPCWPEFDTEKHTGIKISKGIYQQDIGDTDTCPYIFYGYSVNADGLVSSCFLDWGRKLIIGDVCAQSMKEIWNSPRMNALRLQHLEGRRRQNGVCGNCGQLSHCLPDSIDAHRLTLLAKFKTLVAVDPTVEPPGGTNRKFAAVAAE
jgi:radical SAM protein with 4Fe4S-binding SPASM domain